jgi:hypothetical protein
MTEQEWVACANPRAMLEFLGEQACDRKLRLFACACCRHIWHLLADPRSRHAVEVAECYADGEATEEEREVAAGEAWEVDVTDNDLAARAANIAADLPGCEWGSALGVIENAAAAVGRSGDGRSASLAEQQLQCAFLRDLIGPLPFHPVAVSPPVLVWNGGSIPKLAQAIYDNRGFDRLPALANALEEAGCDNPDMLAHCRRPGEHVRGRWVLDLILGKG